MSKFDGMDRDDLFYRPFVSRLGITRHMPIQDALLYILEELDRVNSEVKRLKSDESYKDSRIMALEGEVQMLKAQSQKLGPSPWHGPYYGPTISSTSGTQDPNITTAIGVTATDVSKTLREEDYRNALERIKKMSEEEKKGSFQYWSEEDSFKKNFESKF